MKWGFFENEFGEGRVEINMIKNFDFDKVIKIR